MNKLIKKYLAPSCAFLMLMSAPVAMALASSPTKKAPPAETAYRADACSDFLWS